jgi:hypothetical protein
LIASSSSSIVNLVFIVFSVFIFVFLTESYLSFNKLCALSSSMI